MNDDRKHLIDEALRQQKLLEQSGVSSFLKAYDTSAFQAAIAAASAPAVQAVQSVLDQLKAQQQSAVANLVAPYAEMQRQMQASLVKDWSRGLAQTNLLKDFAGTYQTTLHDQLAQMSAAGIANAYRNMAEMPAIKALAKTASESVFSHIAELQRAQLSGLADTLLRTSARSAFEIGSFVNSNAFRYAVAPAFAAEFLEGLPFTDESELEELPAEEAERRAVEYLNRLAEFIHNLPPGKVTARSMFWFVITISGWLMSALQIYNYYHDKAVAETQPRYEYSKEFEAATQELKKAIEKLDAGASQDILYVVERAATLRISPKAKSATVAVLPPNQVVSLRTSKHQWIQVEYFDYLEGYSKTGWVLKKYLKRIG